MHDVILELKNITKIYGNGVAANRNVSIDFRKGEIHSIVGENGAGKSTLMKIIFGDENYSEGSFILRGTKQRFKNSMDGIKAGIGMVHQHFMLVPSMTVAENIVMGDEPGRLKVFVDYKKAVCETRELAEKYHLEVDVDKTVEELSAGEKQKVEILKTLYRKAEIIILDEPTSVLTPQETDTLFDELHKLKEMGHTIIFISHKMNEVQRISDRITVLRNGECKGTFDCQGVSIEQLTELIVGRSVISSYDSLKQKTDKMERVLEVRNLSLADHQKNILDNISFVVKRGEILGIAGVQGNGQTEVVRAIAGIGEMDKGEIILNGKRIDTLSVKKKRMGGLSYIPEDRLTDGVAEEASVCDNIISTYYDRDDVSGRLFMKKKKVKQIAESLIEQYSIRTHSAESLVGSLSGGNMQKVVVARENNTDLSCMIAEQPTQGIDMGSSEYIRKQLINLRNQGAGVLLVSADLEETVALSDRVIVMYDGKIVAYFQSTEGISLNELGQYMLGIKKQSAKEVEGALL